MAISYGVDWQPDLLTHERANPISRLCFRNAVWGMMFDRIRWALGAVAIGAILSPLASSSTAQQIDPRVLQQVQGQLGAGQPSSSQRLDAARDDANAPEIRDPRAPTAEELELRRQQSRNQLQSLYVPTPVERDFRIRTGEPDLRLFGYDLFRSTEGSSGTLTGSVGDNYVLGVGDELVVSFQGATNASQTALVDREGRLIVGLLPPVRAAGRSLGAVRSELAAATRRALLGTNASVSLGSVRSITVFVGGEVERPGQYQLTALGDVSLALAKAGGIRRTGSLRRVRVVHAGGGIATVDLYGLLGIGAPPAVRLQDGDRIVVPVIGDTVSVTGSVARPAIYELRGAASATAITEYAGGALQPRGYELTVGRIGPDGRETFIRAIGPGQTIVPGDSVLVRGGSVGGVIGRVSLRGFVQNPGVRPLAAARTVHELLGEPEELRTGTYMPMAILVRRDAQTSSKVYEPVNLMSALRDQPRVDLRSEDKLYVFSQADIQFMNRSIVRRIVLGQPNLLPQCRALQRLEILVQDIQSPIFGVLTRGSFIVDRGGSNDLGVDATTKGETGNRNVGSDVKTGGELKSATNTSGAGPLVGGIERREFEDRMRPSGADGQCSATLEEEPDLLPVLIENSVGVGGAVRQPGAYPVAGSTTAEAVIAVSGGMARGAQNIVVNRARSPGRPASSDYDTINVAGPNIAQLALSAGDDIRVDAANVDFEPGAVLLAGEFRHPGLYAIRKGETLSQLIARAGGLTEFAYPYGTVYTRRSVKDLQQEGYRRTARELNSALLAASARKTGNDGDTLTAAAALVERLASVEAPGRMVVEADPRVLSVRSDLDTVLEPGDAIVMPKTPNFVLALGDVANPGALQFIPGKSAKEYLREAGGEQSSADSSRAFLVLPNGTAQPIRSSPWRGDKAVIPPGSTIIVPKDIDPLKTLDLVRDIATIFGQIASGIASVAILATR